MSTSIFPQLNVSHAAELMPGQDADTVTTAFAEQTRGSHGISAVKGLQKCVTSN